MKKLSLFTSIIFSLVLVFDTKAQMCPKSTGTELIVNGDFEAGNTGFTTGYTYNGSSVGPGNYSVGTNPNTLNSYFYSMTDHTPGAGTRMLVVDVDGTVGKDAYATNVTVLPNTTYFFSAWFADINGTFENPPRLQFNINGVQVGSIVNVNPSGNSHAWTQFYVSWNSGAVSGPISIRIQNTRTETNGNDLALDDISFSTSCANIGNLETLGQSSVLPDTVYNCSVSFPYNLNPGLPGTYNLAWKKTAGTTLSTAATYNEPPTPADGTKLYLCYEYVAGCPRTDSVIFKTTPLSVSLGANKVMCAPVNITLNSGVSSPPVNVQWYKNGSPVATTANYTATDIGTYSVTVSRPGCGSASSSVGISTPTSTISGTGNYCSSANTANFTVTGSTQVKWYTTASGGTALNPSDVNPAISLAYSATNTTTLGCASGLYAEDVSSYPGTIIPVSSTATAPCAAINNYNGNSDILVEVNQSMAFTSVDFFQNAGWGNGTFTFSIFNNGPNSGPWCSACGMNKDGPTGAALYSVTSATMTAPASGSAIRTLAISYTLAPGRYWFRLSASGTAMGLFDCNRTYAASSNLWQTPFVDNTGNSVARVITALQGGNNQSSGALMNIKFQVGSANTCSRLFICAIDNCVAPVELLSFEARKGTGGNVITWKTASEINSDFFIVQRSVDGINFVDIGKVAAAGNSTSILSYSFLDAFYPQGVATVYYRLKQIDFDASAHYSAIKQVGNDGLSQELSLYPVPVKKGQNVTMDYVSALDESIIVEIFDNPGKVVSGGQFEVHAGANSIELETSSLASGLYHLRVKGDSSKITKFIVE